MENAEFYGYSNIGNIASDLKHGGVYYLKDHHQMRAGDIVVKPDNSTTGHQIGIVCWVSTDGSEIIVRDRHYDEFKDIDVKDWRYTGMNIRKLSWLSFWGGKRRTTC